MSKGKNRDENYVLDLCDAALGRFSSREHKFEFLLGDRGKRKKGAKLPVDSYYPELELVIEYQERQHSEAVLIFDKTERMTVSGVSRGVQRALYDQRRRDVLPMHGIQLIEFDYSDFAFDSSKRLKRITSEDAKVVGAKLKAYIS